MEPIGKLVLKLASGQKEEFALAKASVTIGRAAINDIVLGDSKVSRVHARLQYSDEGLSLIDLGSANGTRVNGLPIERVAVAPGDIIELGDSTLLYETGPPTIEPEVTLIDSQADVEATLTGATLSMTLSDTHGPRLAVHTPNKTWEIPLVSDALTIGRHSNSDIALDDPRVSRRHAQIECRRGAFTIRDLNSANGIWLGKQRVDEHTLQDGDTIRVGGAQLVFKRGFEHEDLTVVEGPPLSPQPPRRPVVIVPGLFGSQLWRGGERIWPRVKYLFTNPEMYCLPEGEPIEARGLVDEVVIIPGLIKQEGYGRLGDYLEEALGYERGKDLLEFAYDFRQDARFCARQLAEAIDGWKVTGPLTIIAHSLGCLVSRYYVERLGGKKKVERLIMMGGPHHGSPKAIVGLLFGRGLLPFGLMGDRLREVLATFPSAYQVLPAYSCVYDQSDQPIDVLSDELWLPKKQLPLLRSARAARREIGNRCTVRSVSVFGYGLKTVTNVRVRRDSEGRWEKVDLALEPDGDNTIPERSAVLEGSEIHPVQQYHGALHADNDVKMRLKLELTR
ncbi:MAG: FHA domain-containing protein [Dehalococcoidia bacterium]|nr:MAG: FHA domain-containing protein [Dehalococcoidia bacterium]